MGFEEINGSAEVAENQEKKRIYAERKAPKTWEEFKVFQEDLKFKIAQEVARVIEKGAREIENSGARTDSLDISLEKLKEIKLKGKAEILKINPEALQLGKDVQNEIGAQLEKMQKTYIEFIEKMAEIEEKINKILLDMEDEIKKNKLEEVRRRIKKIKKDYA